MTYVRSTKKDQWKRIAFFILGILSALAVLISANWFLRNKAEQAPTSISGMLKEEQKISVVRALRDITAGESADAVKFEVISVPKELVPAQAVASIAQLKDKRVANAVKEKEFLFEDDLIDGAAWFTQGGRLIEHTFQDGAVPAAIGVGSVIDIKLFKPQAQDAVVVSKTMVMGKADRTLSFYLDETEQENIKEANTEGLLFIVQYLDKSQDASAVTYVPAYVKKQ